MDYLEGIYYLIKGNEASCNKKNGGVYEAPKTYYTYNFLLEKSGLKQYLPAHFEYDSWHLLTLNGNNGDNELNHIIRR